MLRLAQHDSAIFSHLLTPWAKCLRPLCRLTFTTSLRLRTLREVDYNFSIDGGRS